MIDSKGSDFGCFGLAVLKWLPKKEKREPFGSAQGKQAPALQTQLSTGISISQIMGGVKSDFEFFAFGENR